MELTAPLEVTLDFTKRFHHRQSNVDGIEYGVVFDVSGRYRYSLWRAWSAYHPRIAFVLLNPSTADEKRNDTSIRSCLGFELVLDVGYIVDMDLFECGA